MTWRTDIENAPRDGTPIKGRIKTVDRYTGRLLYTTRKTWWGKVSHVPIHGWCWGSDPENINLWEPKLWQPLPADQHRGR